ncbi:hypothetical protein J2X45_002512 [Caulobacter sp. BE264]|uniref:hypothetical protein n=1 Tax=Caulobacter sp. BE264 TaxID=2817724 RepID=UPI0028662CFF|nr:hypothetical protein [Caulobacter sp. BE264]MDR7231412.1 hypothetical protein [Caulobacter sp. BE264]
MLLWIGIVLTAAIVVVIVAVVALGWVDHLSQAQRLGLTAIAGGLIWAGPRRAMALDPGLGDIFLLAGLLTFLLATFWRELWIHLDALDGQADGRIGR